MTATYGAIGRIAYAARTNTVIPMPASVGAGDLLLLVHVTANSGTAVTATLPAGWTQLGIAQTGSDGSFGARTIQATRIATGSEPGNYTVTHTATNAEGIIIRVDGTGTLSVDVNSQAQGTGSAVSTILTATSVTTTATDDLLIFTALNWNIGALTPPTGMTEQLDSSFLYVATQALAASGATGDRTQTQLSNLPWFANLAAIKDVAGGGGGGGTMKVWSGSAWVAKPVKVWSGSAWVSKPVKVWSGSAWVTKG